MKKLFTLVLALCTLGGTSFAALPDFNEAVFPWLSTEGLTMYTEVADFRGDDAITRGEAAKFVAEYATVAGLEKTFTECTFADLEEYDETLVPYIAEACAYGLLKGSNGMFMPNDNITEAQATAVVIRSLDGFADETTDPWYKNYFMKAQELGMISEETETSVNETNITRAKLGTWFYQAAMLNNELGTEDETATECVAGEEGCDDTTEDVTEETPNNEAVAQYSPYTEELATTLLAEGKNVILFFHASWSPSSVAADASFAENTLPEGVYLLKVDYDTATDLKATYGVTSEHTFAQLNNDMNAKLMWQGTMNADELKVKLQ